VDSALKRHLPRSAQTIDRRGFLNLLSSSAILTAVPALPVDPPGLAGPSSRSRISLNGEWEHRVNGKFYEAITVPSSRRPSGFYSLNRQFVLPRFDRGDRAFVHFEAITYWGRVSLNGQKLGTMGPYIPYEFEFTTVANEGANEIAVAMADLLPFADGTAKPEIAMGIHPGSFFLLAIGRRPSSATRVNRCGPGGGDSDSSGVYSTSHSGASYFSGGLPLERSPRRASGYLHFAIRQRKNSKAADS
jgi:hypothetical protein